MTDERQRQLVASSWRPIRRRREELMARGGTAARRYAEAAFEVAMRDDTLERWRDELDLAAARPATSSRSRCCPTRRSRSSAAQALDDMLSERVSRPDRICPALLRRGRIEELPRVAAEFRRLDDIGRASPTPQPRPRAS